MEEGGRDACNEDQVQKAIINYQRTYNLPETGELDEKTKSFMSTSRCGNKDEEKDQVKAKAQVKDKQEVEILVNKTEVSTQKNAPGLKLDDGEDNKTSFVKGQRLWKRSAEFGRSRLYRVLAGEKPNTRTHEYHKRHLEDYIQNIRSKAKGQRSLLHRYTPKERKKRSIHVWNTGALFNKEVVRWRLLTTGFSTRIPVEDQRATIDLAFRMWSEVIPLRFIEDTSSDISRVEIHIAFGKGKLYKKNNCILLSPWCHIALLFIVTILTPCVLFWTKYFNLR